MPVPDPFVTRDPVSLVSRGPESDHGFTLIELLVVLGILALILSLLSAYFPKVLDGQQVKGAARELAAGLRAARQQAITLQRPVALSLDVASHRYSVGERTRALKLPPATRVTLRAATAEQQSDHAGSIRFFPDGSATGGEIALHHGTQDYAIQVEWLTGRVSTVE